MPHPVQSRHNEEGQPKFIQCSKILSYHSWACQRPPVRECTLLLFSTVMQMLDNVIPQVELCQLQQQHLLVCNDLHVHRQLGSTRKIQTLPDLSDLGISPSLGSPSDMPITYKTYNIVIND